MKSRVIKYGDNINTDLIIPGKYLVYTDKKELSKYAMEGLDQNFLNRVKKNKIIVAGKNFGCGSSREQAPIALKFSGISFIIAESFARIFYRNSINIGLKVIECEGIGIVEDNDEILIDLKKNFILDVSKDKKFSLKPIPDFLLKIMEKGLVEYIRAKKNEKI